MLKIFLSLVLMASFLVTPSVMASTQNPYLAKYIKNYEPVGSGRLTYMFWDVYDATLYSTNGKLSKGSSFALTLSYLRDIDGTDIADISAEEIRKQGDVKEIDVTAWHKEMTRIFPSVKKGSVLTGVYLPNKGTKFFYNGKEIGYIRDENFSQSFFNIWLGPKSSKPRLRRALMGVK